MPKEAKKKVNEKKDKKDKRHFLKDVKAELKKVIWPTTKQLLNNTIAVIVIVLLVGVIVFALDVCFEKINSLGVEQLKTIVQHSTEKENITNDSEEANDINSEANEISDTNTTEEESNANNTQSVEDSTTNNQVEAQ